MPNLQRATIPKSYAAKFNSKQISARLQKDEMQDSARDLLRSKIYNQCDDGPKTVDRCASVHWRWMEKLWQQGESTLHSEEECET